MTSIITIFLLAAAATATDFEDFNYDDPNDGVVTSVDFEDCPDGQSPCMVHYGGTYNITVNFDFVHTRLYADDLFPVVSLVYENPFGFRDFDFYDYYFSNNIKAESVTIAKGKKPCEEGVLQCPLIDGKSYTYQGSVQFSDYSLLEYGFVFDLRDVKTQVEIQYIQYPVVAARFNVEFYDE